MRPVRACCLWRLPCYSRLQMNETPLFQQRAEASIAKCAELYTRRGDQYGDTWRDCNWLKLRAILFSMFGMKPTISQCRAMGLAAFADMKYWRHLGGYAEDHQLDGINYDAALATEMREIYAGAGSGMRTDPGYRNDDKGKMQVRFNGEWRDL